MHAVSKPSTGGEPLPFEVRRSEVHGLGVFAVRPIKKGERLCEYVGERVSHEEADRRYESKDANDNHTFLFTVDDKTVIDAGVGGSDARYFNHSCDPNCESLIENRRVFIEAIRDIEPGEELTYDYQIGREKDDPPNIDEIFACHCGSSRCRGSMLWPPKRAAKKSATKRAKAKAQAKRAAGKQARGKSSKGKSKQKASATQAKRAPVQARSRTKAKRKAAAKGQSKRKSAAKSPVRAKSKAKTKARAKAKR